MITQTELHTYYTVKQTADYLKTSVRNIYRLLDEGLLPFQTFGTKKGYRIAESDLVNFIESRKN